MVRHARFSLARSGWKPEMLVVLHQCRDKTGAGTQNCTAISNLPSSRPADWTMPANWSRLPNLHRPLRVTSAKRRCLRLTGRKMETRPGLAPDKGRVAAVRLDGFGMRVLGETHGNCTRTA